MLVTHYSQILYPPMPSGSGRQGFYSAPPRRPCILMVGRVLPCPVTASRGAVSSGCGAGGAPVVSPHGQRGSGVIFPSGRESEVVGWAGPGILGSRLPPVGVGTCCRLGANVGQPSCNMITIVGSSFRLVDGTMDPITTNH